jgi:hypothetical protein
VTLLTIRQSTYVLVRVVAIAAAGLIAAGCGEKKEPAAPPPPAPTTPAELPADIEDAGREEVLEASGVPDEDDAPAGEEAPPTPADEATAAARRYIAALDSRDGARVCDLLAPGALREIELPRERNGCSASLEASIGYADPRGLPVWASADAEAVVSAKADGDEATVILTVFTRFADRDEPSVEDDVIHLRRAGEGWRVAQPSLTLYRAVGQEPPLSALATG